MLDFLVIATVSAALVLGALWGLYGRLSTRLEGFIIALSGGALIVALMSGLVEPSARQAGTAFALGFVILGALIFTAIDYVIDEVWDAGGGSGLLLAITLDGVPENLALGVALISAGPLGALSLAASIFLSNLPEAAGGARRMCDSGRSRLAALALWGGAAALLTGAALAGHLLLGGIGDRPLAAIRCLAAGAVVASLATEIFPSAFRRDAHLSGIAVSLGLAVAFALHQLGGSSGTSGRDPQPQPAEQSQPQRM